MAAGFMKYVILVSSLVLVCMGSCTSSGLSEGNQRDDVIKIYNTNCGICHGKDGRKGLAGAKFLPESELNLKERISIITNGKGQMMPYKNILSEKEIKAIAEYTMTFE